MNVTLCKKFVLIAVFASLFTTVQAQKSDPHLTLIPPGMITNKVNLDIRAGISNTSTKDQSWDVEIYVDKINKRSRILKQKHWIAAGKTLEVKHVLPKGSLLGSHKIILKASRKGNKYIKTKTVEVVASDIRSTQTIDGAWAGIYHWSEIEGKTLESRHQKTDR
ncbi:MAG: hypothetical protein NVV59_18215 [Chitinophagaceae bacterium]|nr:hypothetical protein [Chitinophagaceae bacterium]